MAGYSYLLAVALVVGACGSIGGQEEAESVTSTESMTSSEGGTDAGTPPPPQSRRRRDGYGGGGGYGGGYGGGSYGCHCPYQYCDNNSDMLLYFSAGALLGLLFSMLQPQMMMMAAAGGGREHPGQEEEAKGFMSNLPNLLTDDVAPLTIDLVNVYSKSQKKPECGRRWLCEVTQQSLKQGGLRARLTSLSSVAISWFMKDMMPFMENLTENDGDVFDCSLLGPKCHGFFQQETET